MGTAAAPRTAIRHAIPHLPALDGLRGLALLGVLFFHAQGALPGGYLGVDLFFVLSGYLITSLLLAEHARDGRIGLSAFWLRRIKRLLPALLSIMPAIAVYGRFFAKAEEIRGLRADAVATLGYVANWRAIFAHKSYWELFAAPSPLEHMWSLSIEEQFYVFWPLLVTLVLRRGSSRSILGLALVLAGASMIAMGALYDPANVSRVYLGTDTRAAGILLGAVLSCLVPPSTTFSARAVKLLDGAGIAAAAGLAYAWGTLDGQRAFLYRGGLWLTELAVLVLVTCGVAGRASLVGRALAFRPLGWVGTISYGLYLWHWPVNVFLTPERTHLIGVRLHALQFAVTFAIAIASYHGFEQPIRTGRLRFGRVGRFGRALVLAPTSIGVAMLLVLGATHASADSRVFRAPATSSLTPPPGAASYSAYSGELASFRVMMVGDSTANSLGWALRTLRKPGLAVELKGHDGCTILADMCGAPDWGTFTSEVKPHASLVFLGGAFMHGLSLDGDFRKACYPGWDSVFRAKMETHLRALLTARDGVDVWAVTVPYPLGPWETKAFHHEVACINEGIVASAEAVPGVHVLDLAEHLCPGGVCVREHEGKTIRPDGVHYTVDGAEDVARWILAQIQR